MARVPARSGSLTSVASHSELMRLHIEALFVHDAEQCMVRVNEPNGALAPRFFLGRTSDGIITRVRYDIGQSVREELEAASKEDALGTEEPDSPIDPTRYEEILARSAPVENVSTGPAFCFPRELPPSVGIMLITDRNAHVLEALLAPWFPDVAASYPLFALTVDGNAVSVCGSVRRTLEADEAGVETVPAYRGHGYAALVVAAWARAVRDLEREPLYSTSWQNETSRAVARKLGLIQFGSDLHIA